LAQAKARSAHFSATFTDGSSLKTWLRAILAQRHIDSIRAGRRFEELAADETGDTRQSMPLGPERCRATRIASVTLLPSRAPCRPLSNASNHAKKKGCAFITPKKNACGDRSLLGEHESSVSRHLDRVRRDLRQAVEDILCHGLCAANGFAAQPGLSDAEIALCLEYCAGDSPMDLDKLLRAQNPKARRPESERRDRALQEHYGVSF